MSDDIPEYINNLFTEEEEAAPPAPAPEQEDADTDSEVVSEERESQPERQSRSSGPKDITLEDGTVIKGGAERRLYEKWKIANEHLEARKNEFNQLQQKFSEVSRELEATKQAIATANGLPPEQLAQAVTLFQELKTNPSGVINYLLTQAQEAGIRVGNESELSSAAIVQAIKRELAPLLNPRVDDEEQVRYEAQREVAEFYSRYPDARIHDEVLARIVQRYPEYSLTDAYYALRQACADRGLDFSLPLDRQVPRSAPPRTPNNGRVISDTTDAADYATDHREIIQNVLRRHGLYGS